MGPTASGKTNIALNLRRQKYKVDIISVDSALVYRGMDIGTAKPVLEELKIAPHKLINVREPDECYSVADFYRDANKEIEKIIKFDRVPLLVGGTMLYFKTLLRGLFFLPHANKEIRRDIQFDAKKFGWINVYNKLKYVDPIAASVIHLNDHKRITRALEVFFISGKTYTELKLNSECLLPYRVYQFAVMPSSREILNKRIEERFYKMLDIGFEDEVRMLFARPELHRLITPSILCVGYRQMWQYLSGKISYNDMIITSISATKKLAKRQLTWLRQWPSLCWLNSDNLVVALDNISKILTHEV